MLAFTLVARGAAAATLPSVSLVRPAPGEIVQDLQTGGAVQAADPLGVEAPAGLTVKKWLAQPGQKIKAGDPLLQLDADEAAEALARAGLELEQLRLDLQKLLDGVSVDSGALSGAATALERAKADAQGQREAAQKAVAEAQAALDAAAGEASARAAALEALRAQQDPAASAEELDAAAAALDEANARRDQAAAALEAAKDRASAAELSGGRLTTPRALMTRRQKRSRRRKNRRATPAGETRSAPVPCGWISRKKSGRLRRCGPCGRQAAFWSPPRAARW